MGIGLGIGAAVGASFVSPVLGLLVAVAVGIFASGFFYTVQGATEDE